MAVPLVYPSINGMAYDFSSIEAILDGTTYTGFSDISYSHTLEPGILRGTRSIKLARTRGQLDAEASLTMYLADYQVFRKKLGLAFMERSFQIVVNYSDFESPLQTDTLKGCRIVSTSNSHSAGSDPLSKELTLNVMEILEDGIPAVSDGAIRVQL